MRGVGVRDSVSVKFIDNVLPMKDINFMGDTMEILAVDQCSNDFISNKTSGILGLKPDMGDGSPKSFMTQIKEANVINKRQFSVHIYKESNQAYIKFGTFNLHKRNLSKAYYVDTISESDWLLNATNFKIGEDPLLDQGLPFRKILIEPSSPYLFMPTKPDFESFARIFTRNFAGQGFKCDNSIIFGAFKSCKF